MAIVTCPGCGRSVNDKTGDCPRCGCTLAYVRHAPKSEKAGIEKSIKLQIDVYVPVGDGTRDRGEKIHTLYFNDDEINLAYQYQVIESYALADIMSVDCYKAEKPRNNDAATMAAAGLVLGGVVGAVAGGIVGSADKVSWYLEIVTGDKTRTFRLQSESHKKNIVKWAVQHGLMTEAGISIPAGRAGAAKGEPDGDEDRLIEKYRSLMPEFRAALWEQMNSLTTLQSKLAGRK